jgi:cellulose synthase/poly-beta-1,6-N-acetylglucosamine synthase-like glycosyltransferase
MLFFYFVAALILFQLVLPFLTVVATKLVGEARLGTPSVPSEPKDYGCIITAYRNAQIAMPLIDSLLRQTHGRFQIYLVADNCPSDFQAGIQDPRLSVFIPDPALNLKAKSIMYAMDRYVRPHDYTVVFDADNLAHPHFLEVVEQYAQAGHRCIQGQRKAKNTDNHFAAADALGEHYKNYIERYAPYVLGSSAVISGSGMATQTALYRAYLDSPAIQEGQHLGKKMLQEDKILQNYLLLNGEKIAFAKNAICYDEKVQSADAVQTQRSRWLFSYFQNLPTTLNILAKGVATLNWNAFLFGLVTLSLPMFIQLGVAFLVFVFGLFLSPWISLAVMAAVVVFSGTVLWTLALSGHPELLHKALTAIPAFIARQARGLLGMSNPAKNFKHTEHTQLLSVDEVMEKERKKDEME